MTEGDTAPNLYRSSIGGSLPAARTSAADAAGAFAGARLAMERGAWSSGAADAFMAELTGHAGAAGTAAGECRDALQSRYDHEPAVVDRTDWRARWGTRRGPQPV